MKKLIFTILVITAAAGAYVLMSGPGGTETPGGTVTPSVSATVTPSPSVSGTPRPSASPSTKPTPGISVSEVQIHNMFITNFSFSPASVTVQKGDIVIFKNLDSTLHTVTAANGAFNSGSIQSKASWTLVTDKLNPGTYEFSCGFHASMRGTLIVR